MNKKNLYKTLILLFILVAPFAVSAQPSGNFIPCTNDCGYYHLIQLVNNIINWIIMISIPVAAGIFAWAGIQYMTTAISGKKEAAKKMMQNVLIGFVFILSAWIIVSTIMNTLLSNEYKGNVPIEGVN